MYSIQSQIKDTSNPLNKDLKGVIDIGSQKVELGYIFLELIGPK